MMVALLVGCLVERSENEKVEWMAAKMDLQAVDKKVDCWVVTLEPNKVDWMALL
jgi:hypothetical protein